jgi:hypothetical protein
VVLVTDKITVRRDGLVTLAGNLRVTATGLADAAPHVQRAKVSAEQAGHPNVPMTLDQATTQCFHAVIHLGAQIDDLGDGVQKTLGSTVNQDQANAELYRGSGQPGQPIRMVP